MRQSASRIRSLANRYALAEAAAFPGIGTERDHLPSNRRPAAESRHSFPRFVHQV
jgi:plasmid stabilization system protein ParE